MPNKEYLFVYFYIVRDSQGNNYQSFLWYYIVVNYFVYDLLTAYSLFFSLFFLFDFQYICVHYSYSFANNHYETLKGYFTGSQYHNFFLLLFC